MTKSVCKNDPAKRTTLLFIKKFRFVFYVYVALSLFSLRNLEKKFLGRISTFDFTLIYIKLMIV